MEARFAHFALIVLALFSVAAVSGCVSQGPSCPTCQAPSAWSSCTADAQKTRTNYKCGEDTSYKCESYTEQGTCNTALSLTGRAGLSATVSPTLDENVKGILKVTMDTLPAGSIKVWVMLVPQGFTGQEQVADPNAILQIVDDPEAGKSVYIDTTKVENGVYTIGVMSTVNPNGAPWTDVVQTQLLVGN